MASPDLKVAEGSSGLKIEHLRKSYRKKDGDPRFFDGTAPR